MGAAVSGIVISPIVVHGFSLRGILLIALASLTLTMEGVCLRTIPIGRDGGKGRRAWNVSVTAFTAVSAAAAVTASVILLLGAVTPGRPPAEGDPMVEGGQYVIISPGKAKDGFAYVTSGQIMEATGVPVRIEDDMQGLYGGVGDIDWLDSDGVPHTGGRLLYRGDGTIGMYDSDGKPIRRQDPSVLKRMSIGAGQWPGYRSRGRGLEPGWAAKHGIVDTSPDPEAYRQSPIPSATVDKGAVKSGGTLRDAWIMEFGGRFYALPVGAKTGTAANLFAGAQ